VYVPTSCSGSFIDISYISATMAMQEQLNYLVVENEIQKIIQKCTGHIMPTNVPLMFTRRFSKSAGRLPADRCASSAASEFPLRVPRLAFVTLSLPSATPFASELAQNRQ
jgi:hypothetical protein